MPYLICANFVAILFIVPPKWDPVVNACQKAPLSGAANLAFLELCLAVKLGLHFSLSGTHGSTKSGTTIAPL